MLRHRLVSKTQQQTHHRGVALTEFACTLPVLLVLLMGTIESSSMIYLKQTLHIAAYESARVSLVPGSTTAQVKYAATQILTDRRVRDAVITISPTGFASAPVCSYITVTITAPSNSNFGVPMIFCRDKTITGTCTMMKEY